MDELSERGQAGRGPCRKDPALPQPAFFVAEVFTGSPGKLVAVEDTIKGFKGIVAGDYDDLPEAAFYIVGGIDEVIEKAKMLAAEAA
jgi:F-type H+-transporting ATPase subunit beta